MNGEEREAHIRRMMAHTRKVTEQNKRETAEFERGCRQFWDFMRTVRSLSEPVGTKRIWDHIHTKERT